MMRNVLTCLAMLLVGCASATESTTCAAGKICTDHAGCGPLELCVPQAGCASTCQTALPRKLTLTLEKATDFSGFGDDGTPWDKDGPPDPYAKLEAERLGQASQVVCQTATVTDTDMPVWKKVCTITLESTSKLTFSVWDEDGATDTLMLQSTLDADAVLTALKSATGEGTAQATARLWYRVTF